MFTAFIRPARELLVVFVLLALALGFGRHLAFSGDTWNTFACAATAITFAVATTRLRAVKALDVPVRTWLGGLTLTSVIWSLLLGGVGTASAVISQLNSPYYSWYDQFLSTAGPMDWVDTEGDPYVFDGAGIGPGRVLLTFAVYSVALLFSALLGALAAAVRLRFGTTAMVLAVAVILIVLVVVWMLWARGADPAQAQWSRAELFLSTGVPGLLLAGLLTWLLARRVEP